MTNLIPGILCELENRQVSALQSRGRNHRDGASRSQRDGSSAGESGLQRGKVIAAGEEHLPSVEEVAKGVRIEVQDEGTGLSAEDQKKLFGKFARLSAKPTGGEHSTGRGLPIVKKMVRAMNGRVWCESELGQGATFIMEFSTTSG
jgi:signal transduction histidine kinase